MVAMVGVFLLMLAAGSVNIPLRQTIIIPSGGEAEKASRVNIVLKVRLLKAITAMLAGAALSVSGLLLLLILLIARRVENSLTLLIPGLMVGNLTFALVSLLLYFSIPERIQAYI
jgi:ABC-type Fe3+-siderophore transport system permease subunit